MNEFYIMFRSVLLAAEVGFMVKSLVEGKSNDAGAFAALIVFTLVSSDWLV